MMEHPNADKLAYWYTTLWYANCHLQCSYATYKLLILTKGSHTDDVSHMVSVSLEPNQSEHSENIKEITSIQ